MAEENIVVSVPVITDSHENPFVANGELSQKADYIISHSKITRTEVHIADPDAVKNGGGGDQLDGGECIAVTTTTTLNAAPPSPNNRPDGTTVVASKPVEVEVSKGNAAAAQPQHAEEVKINKGRKCCTVL